jgi:uncharacterized protein YndB with AHSA1/START domain
MSQKNETIITKDTTNKKLLIVREFEAPVDQVWDAWTQSELLDQWWAPKPYKAITKSMDFREGGFWLYYMKGPEGDIHWCRADYSKIIPQKEFEYQDAFCDENGVPNNFAPSMHWNCYFSPSDLGTKVSVEVSFKSEADLEKIVEMGFKEGFTAAHGNLDEVLSKVSAG